MSLSPFDSFQSRFVTYLLNRPPSNINIYITVWIPSEVPRFSNKKEAIYVKTKLH